MTTQYDPLLMRVDGTKSICTLPHAPQVAHTAPDRDTSPRLKPTLTRSLMHSSDKDPCPRSYIPVQMPRGPAQRLLGFEGGWAVGPALHMRILFVAPPPCLLFLPSNFAGDASYFDSWVC